MHCKLYDGTLTLSLLVIKNANCVAKMLSVKWKVDLIIRKKSKRKRHLIQLSIVIRYLEINKLTGTSCYRCDICVSLRARP